MNQNNQLSLFVPGMTLDDSINRVFTAKPVVNNKGVVVGTSIVALNSKELPDNLKGKAHKTEREAAILLASDSALRMVKGEIAALGDNFTFKSVLNRKDKDGLRTITFKVKEVTRFKAPEVEAMAKALGLSVDEVKAMAKKQADKLANVTDIASTQNGAEDTGEVADAEYLASLSPEERAQLVGK